MVKTLNVKEGHQITSGDPFLSLSPNEERFFYEQSLILFSPLVRLSLVIILSNLAGINRHVWLTSLLCLLWIFPSSRTRLATGSPESKRWDKEDTHLRVHWSLSDIQLTDLLGSHTLQLTPHWSKSVWKGVFLSIIILFLKSLTALVGKKKSAIY